ncbi:MFS transporter [Vallitalea pronyensis]|uniref:MFS transporter n=1 Tax=Vallitalea pronyensis TaxID=1348613 RepID=A0A8J8MJJ9_9FIRM|nr:MFS transporter [Vallitalea pronyensis]QUI22759.1 MFS transporter [Vallitalea pronyensis]
MSQSRVTLTKIVKGYIGGKFRRIYLMAYPENDREVNMSLNMYKYSEAASITMTQLAGGTFLASLLLRLNFQEEGIAVVFGLSNIASVLQLFTAVWVQKMLKRKPFVCGSVLLKSGLALMFFLPLFLRGNTHVRLIAAGLYLLGYIGIQIGNSPAKDWVVSMVPDGKRGYYFAKTDAFSVGVITISTIGMGLVMDFFQTRNETMGFVTVGFALLVLVMLNFIAFSRMKEKRITRLDTIGREMHGRMLKRQLKEEEIVETLSLFKEMKLALSNNRFRRELMLSLLFTTGFQMGLPFNASYQIKELSLSFSFIMITGACANGIRIFISPRIGRLADKIGTGKVLKFAFVGLMMHHVLMSFANENNGQIMIPAAILSAALAWSFVGTGLLNLQFDLLDEKKMTIQLSLVSLFSSVWGYVTILLSTGLFSMFERLFDAHNINLYPQQGLNAVNVIVYLLTIIYIHYRIQTLKRVK